MIEIDFQLQKLCNFYIIFKYCICFTKECMHIEIQQLFFSTIHFSYNIYLEKCCAAFEEHMKKISLDFTIKQLYINIARKSRLKKVKNYFFCFVFKYTHFYFLF